MLRRQCLNDSLLSGRKIDGKINDLTGKKFGKLTALFIIGTTKHRKKKWLCICDCADEPNSRETKTRTVIGGDLTSGRTRSCGCKYAEARTIDLTGREFGKLVAIENTQIQNRQGNWIWKCKCSCGNYCEVTSGSLVSGNTKSCGCLVKETLNARTEDFTGRKIGEYTVTTRAWKKEHSNSGPIWKCECSCGNTEVYKTPYELKNDMLLWCKSCRQVRQSQHMSGINNSRWNGYNACGIPNYNNYADQIQFAEEVQRCRQDINILQVKCKYCGRWYTPTVYETQRRIKALYSSKNLGTENSFFCSNACKRSCPTYRRRRKSKDESRMYKKSTSREVQPELRKMVFERDNYTCQRCGKSKKNDADLVLHCHHKYGIQQNPIESADVDTCLTLCAACHNDVHSKFGCRRFDLRCS